MAVKKTALDATDWQILAELQSDARKTFQEIGEAVGMTRPAVRERVLRMEDSGVITGYRAEIDPSAIGKAMHAMLSFKFNSDWQFQSQPNDTLIRLLSATPEVVCFWDTYGDLDFLIEVAFASKEDLDEFLEKIRRYGFVRTHLIVKSTRTSYNRTEEE